MFVTTFRVKKIQWLRWVEGARRCLIFFFNSIFLIRIRFTRKIKKINPFKVSFVTSGLEELLLLQVPKNNKQGFWLFQILFSKFLYFLTFIEVLSAYPNNNDLVYRWSWSETVQFRRWLSFFIVCWKEQATNPQRNNSKLLTEFLIIINCNLA